MCECNSDERKVVIRVLTLSGIKEVIDDAILLQKSDCICIKKADEESWDVSICVPD